MILVYHCFNVFSEAFTDAATYMVSYASIKIEIGVGSYSS